ncbi:uncharacterized protein LOC116766658 isoform X1 [Danaus plexippus]|uniref:uncharacterized protein LOC116766658 isoform X1 n=1 Tax=Danaus plexippus TaxID=13037 RepID=UPI002AB1CE76|nr:uncharacterized protein LOC116766658 isoform X1 [Danaus plexippus]
MMPNLLSMLISLVAFHTSTIAAPNQNKHSVINENLEDVSAFDNPFELSDSSNNDPSSIIEREKRFFDNIFPTIDLVNRRQHQYQNYDGYTNSEYNRNTGGSGGGLDSFFRNPYDLWLELLSNRRSPPIVLPIFVQPITCVCPAVNTNSPPTKEKEPIPPSTNGPPIVNQPDLTNRFNPVSDEDDDGRRPLSFKPVAPKLPPSQTPPPFEHGSVQEGIEPPSANSPFQESELSKPLPDIVASSQPEAPAVMPSICDGAIIACCFQTNIGNCFERQGCSEPAFSDPCDPPVVLKVIENFQRNGEVHCFCGRRASRYTSIHT